MPLCHVTFNYMYIVLCAEWYIYRNKYLVYLEQPCDFLSYLAELKSKLQMEKEISYMHCKPHIFYKLWGKVLEMCLIY